MPDNGQVTLQWIKIYIHIYKNAININDNNDDDNHNKPVVTVQKSVKSVKS